ncbi:hypothetical protein [Streptomyces sp. NPDC051001]|uniref:hypothetical protein n=1 Tax=Streptomyces sp. NPDC051001 TaxID=3155795 RepID=UPI00341227FB
MTRWRTVPVAVLEYEGALALRAAPDCRLTVRGRAEEITTREVPESERPALMAAYQKKYGGMPAAPDVLTTLPDPADIPSSVSGPATEARD